MFEWMTLKSSMAPVVISKLWQREDCSAFVSNLAMLDLKMGFCPLK